MNNPLVSILIPVYNTEKYVAEAIESALNQTYKNIEIIIVDDGSTDKSWEIIESYRQKYPDKIKTYRQKNKGACAARNKAFELSSGQYIQYLDADDLLAPDKIEHQIKYFDGSGNDDFVVNGRWGRFKESISEEIVWGPHESIQKNLKPIDWILKNQMSQTSCWLTPRNLVLKAGKWDETLKKNQDGEFFCRVLLQTGKIYFSSEAQVYYRNSDNSITNKFSYESAFNTLVSYELYMQHLAKYLNQKEVRLALAANFSSFYAYTYPYFEDLLHRAEKRIEELGFNHFPLIGGRKFKLLSAIIGVKKATYIRWHLILKHKVLK
jgi:glycosyltransferase involved in cell wall biosynthesis